VDQVRPRHVLRHLHRLLAVRGGGAVRAAQEAAQADGRRRLIRALAPLAVILISSLAQAEPLALKPLARGISYAKFSTGQFDGHLFRVELDQVDVRVLESGARKQVKELVAGLPKVIATNASYFGNDDRAMGLVAGKGKPIVQWSALVIEKGEARIVPARFAPPKSVVVQGMPRLVVDGRVEHLKEQVARRTAVCADGKKLTLVVASAAEFNAFARFLALPADVGGAGCTDALNLDGGPSTQLVARAGDLVLALDGQPVPNALAIIPR
jgi:hypothetical protein